MTPRPDASLAPTERPGGYAGDPMPPVLAGLIVFGASAAIVVLEILAVRLLAPFMGITLETTTAVIGTVLGDRPRDLAGRADG